MLIRLFVELKDLFNKKKPALLLSKQKESGSNNSQTNTAVLKAPSS